MLQSGVYPVDNGGLPPFPWLGCFSLTTDTTVILQYHECSRCRFAGQMRPSATGDVLAVNPSSRSGNHLSNAVAAAISGAVTLAYSRLAWLSR